MDRLREAARLMSAFAERTGLVSEKPQRRYLWTDAFAVGNLLGLARGTGDSRYEVWALRLVDAVHHGLGRHRGDDSRRGWISGLDEEEGEAHPTWGGLRIGKSLPERDVREPFDEALEWERDGQYLHYLTKWMQALDLVARQTRSPHFNLWARELAQAALPAFTTTSMTGIRRLVWKMSIDLSHPLVGSMGQHHALDFFVACAELRATAFSFGLPKESGSLLDEEIADLRAQIDPRGFTTSDSLGIGGLLLDAGRLSQLEAAGTRALYSSLLESAVEGLRLYIKQGDFRRPPSRRLAFRELGLAIGLHAVEGLTGGIPPELRSFSRLREDIEGCWLDPGNHEAGSWSDHRDINEVMLATSLSPEGWLVLPRVS